MWVLYALLSAFFASLTAVLAKIGIDRVDSHLATAIRTGAVLVLAWGMAFITGAHRGLQDITRKSLIFLGLSGAATGLSWLCYYRAIQIGKVSRVAPVDKFSIVLTLILAFVFLKEQPSLQTIIGAGLIGIGTVVMVL
ncbi:MAG: EamA family transporter [Treponema sp.]|jgi:transporter family protein|nr:EamA family transporter [Treponema sp.]